MDEEDGGAVAVPDDELPAGADDPAAVHAEEDPLLPVRDDEAASGDGGRAPPDQEHGVQRAAEDLADHRRESNLSVNVPHDCVRVPKL